MLTIDCCMIEGTAIRTPLENMAESNFSTLPSVSYCFRIRIRIPKEITEEMPCAITVAMATPATPSFHTATIHRSSTTFKTEEKIRSISGI